MPGTFTYKDLVDMVVLHTNRADKTALVKKAINLGLVEIGQRHRWNELRATAELTINLGDYSVAGPEGLDKVFRARLKNEGMQNLANLEFLPATTFADRFPSRETATTNGTACYLSVVGNTVHINVRAASTTTIYLDYLKTVQLLVADTDVSEISGIDNAIVAWVTRYIYQSIQMTQDAQIWSGEFERALLMAVRRDSDRPGEKLVPRGTGDIGMTGDNPTPWLDPFVRTDVVGKGYDY